MDATGERLIKRRDAEALTGIRTTSLYRAMQKGLFPKNVAVGFGEINPGVAWIESEVREYVAARAAGASIADLRALVTRQLERRAPKCGEGVA